MAKTFYRVNKNLLLIMMASCCLPAFGQQVADSANAARLKEVIIKSWMRRDVGPLPDEQNGFLNSGKKTETINVGSTNANIAIKTGRQLFAKIPGVFVYDMDGSGNQALNEKDLLPYL